MFRVREWPQNMCVRQTQELMVCWEICYYSPQNVRASDTTEGNKNEPSTVYKQLNKVLGY